MSLLLAWRSTLADRFRSLEDSWFDWRWRLETTTADPNLRTPADIVGAARDGVGYLPARPSNVRRMLAALPIRDAREYTFVDLGSGKGRVVFQAAAQPFAKVIGVEYSAALHAAAVQNLRTLRASQEQRRRIELLHANAVDFRFPTGNLVVHMFNPFGPEAMSHVLENVQNALDAEPRHVLIVLLWPVLSSMVARQPRLRISHEDRRFHIFEAGAPNSA